MQAAEGPVAPDRAHATEGIVIDAFAAGNAHALAMLATAAAALGLGAWVAQRERGSHLGLLFLGLALSIAGWVGAHGLTLGAGEPEAALRWARAALAAACLLPALLLHLTALFLQRGSLRHLWVPFAWVVAAVLAVATQGGGGVLRGVARHSWGFYGQLGPWGGAVLLWVTLGVGSCFWMLWTEHASTTLAAERERLAALLSALALGSLACIDFLPAFGYDVYPAGYLAAAGGLAMVGHRALRLRLAAATPPFAAAEVLETIQDAVLVVDFEDRVRLANPAASRLLGMARRELLGTPIGDLIETPQNVGSASDTLLHGGSFRDRAMMLRAKQGARIEAEVNATLLRGAGGAPAGIVYVIASVQDRRRAAEIEYQAYHDALTGLPNRTLFLKRLEEAIARPRRRVVALLFLDLDGFKLINDSLGHSVGDRLLQTVARRLRHSLRDEDVVARLGGDEFTILLELGRESDGLAVGRKVLAAIAEPVLLEGQELYVTASIGVALFPGHGADAETLLKNADTAMYAAKEGGKNDVQAYQQAAGRRVRVRVEMERDLRRALARDELRLEYQPVVDLVAGGVTGVEALLRWQRGGRQLPPEEFIPVAEDSRLILPIGEWVLASACRAAAGWQRPAAEVSVAVNLSAVQLATGDIVRTVAAALAQSGLPPHLLELEITESAAMTDLERTLGLFHELRRLGVRLAIDDFGTGYSSLSYLQRYPVDRVKIDRSFVHGLGSSRADAIVVATLAMARALGLQVTAEGVETGAQLEVLRREGCHAAQGRWFCAPLSAEAVMGFLVAASGLGGGEEEEPGEGRPAVH
ncbi:MAG TPA: EAL domain-containing protein [Thermoanaerobaculia bacterium]|nr:EAL domain-containing protein [Thermoanaerobaculia bacterium]